jgi:pimeloyl-ACP methyl ester carboxylesterase
MTSTAAASPGCAPLLTASYRGGDGTPIILLHGAGMSWRVWRPVLPLLTGRHAVFAPTLAGHRGGPRLRPGDTPGVLGVVNALCDQLDAAGIDTAHLVGNSLGGWVALELARRGRAHSVIGLSPAGTWQSRRDLLRLLWMFRLGHITLANPSLNWMTRDPLLRHTILSRLTAHPGRIPTDQLDDLLTDLRDSAGFTALLCASLRPLAEFDIATCPVKIAWGEHDRVLPYHRYGHPMQQIVRGAEFIILPGVGHVPMHDNPSLIAKTILETTTATDATHRIERPPRTRRRPTQHAGRHRRHDSLHPCT